jgi:NAD(P)-dependent dehydrogenase (short-subunit alcohol dehydrogenase family)
MPTVSFNGRMVVITGAGSGIGRALAIALATEGSLLALSDIDQVGLEDTHAQCVLAGAAPRTDFLDVTDRAAMAAYADDVVNHFGRVDVVFNNAGVIFTGAIMDSRYDDIERVMDVDFWGVVNGTKAFLPYLIESGGRLVNISSAYGLIAAPGYSAYNAAKFAVRGFTEAVQQEVRNAGHPVRISCVYPGAVQTSIVRTGRFAQSENHADINDAFDKMARTTPAQAAATILRGVRAGKSRILVGPDAIAADVLGRLGSSGYQQLFRLVRYANQRRRNRTAAQKEI